MPPRTITVDKYDSKTGAGTLSYYARQYGTTVDALARTNNIANPNQISEGQALTLPSSGPSQNTTAYRQNTSKNKAQFDEELAGINTKALEIKGQIDAMAAEEVKNKGKNNNTKTDPVVDEYEGMTPEDIKLRKDATNQITELENRHKNVQKYVDDQHNEMLSSIRNIYSARINRMEDSNSRLLKAKGVSNIRGGRTRYTQDLASGILTDEEQQGEMRIVELEAAMLADIAEANNAKQKGDDERFNAHYDRVTETRDKLNEQIKENFRRVVESEKLRLDQEKADRDAEKQLFETGLKKATAAAPALVDKLKQLTTAEERTQFIELYAERLGVDPDVVMGEVEKATQDADYKGLQIDNIKNQIANRNSSNALAWQREKRLATQDEEDETLDETNNVLNGISNYEDLDPKVQEQVKAQLNEYGLFEQNPPDWFIQEYEQQAVGDGDTIASPAEIQSAWQEYRQSRGII